MLQNYNRKISWLVVITLFSNCISLPPYEERFANDYNCMEGYIYYKEKFEVLKKNQYKFTILPSAMMGIGMWVSVELFITGVVLFPFSYFYFERENKKIHNDWKNYYCSK